MSLIRRICLYLLAGVILAGFITSAVKVRNLRQQLPADLVRAEAMMVDPALLKVTSGEFKGLLADYLLIKVAVFLGGDERANAKDWTALYLMLKQAMALDPYFYQSTYLIQGNLVWKEGMAAKAIELLKTQAKYRYWDWEPDWFIGFNYLNFFKDKSKALQYLEKASKIPGAAPIAGLLAARLAKDRSGTVTALAMLEKMIAGAEDEAYKKILKNRYESYLGQYRLEQAIVNYEKKFGHAPDSLEALVQTGILEKLPQTPAGESYNYDPQTAEVYFGKVKAIP